MQSTIEQIQITECDGRVLNGTRRRDGDWLILELEDGRKFFSLPKRESTSHSDPPVSETRGA